MLGDGPSLEYRGSDCYPSGAPIRRTSASPCDRTLADLHESHVMADDEYAALASQRPDSVYAFRALDLFCTGGVCGAQVPGSTLVGVGDRSHWTFEGALYVAPFLACFLDRNGLLFPPGVDLGERSPTW